MLVKIPFIMMLIKLMFSELLIILIKKMELMIYNGTGYKLNKILRLNTFFGILMVVPKVSFHFMLIQKLLNKKMTGLQH